MRYQLTGALIVLTALVAGCESIDSKTLPDDPILFADLDAASFVRRAARRPRVRVNIDLEKCYESNPENDAITTQSRARTCPIADDIEWDNTNFTCAQANTSEELRLNTQRRIRWRSNSGLKFRLKFPDDSPMADCGTELDVRQACDIPDLPEGEDELPLKYDVYVEDTIQVGNQTVVFKCMSDPRIYVRR